MAWRTVVIGNPSSLRVEDSQLVIAREGEETALPLEDIAVLVLESRETALTAMLLSRLAELDALVLLCDAAHLPHAALLPFAGHSRLLKTQRLQLAASQPFLKRCWQAVIRQKIANQAECLRLLAEVAGAPPSLPEGYEGSLGKGAGGIGSEMRLRALIPAVTSGDATNVEGQVARLYFRHLFGKDFTRMQKGESENGDWLAFRTNACLSPLSDGGEDYTTANAGLNYGYAVMRAAVARALVCHGFLPAHGLHHCSELNPYNLADDLLEPLRPVVDLCVAQEIAGAAEFTKAHRATLVGLLYREVLIDGKRQAALRAADIMAASLLTACAEKDPRRLKLPELLPPARHAYD